MNFSLFTLSSLWVVNPVLNLLQICLCDVFATDSSLCPAEDNNQPKTHNSQTHTSKFWEDTHQQRQKSAKESVGDTNFGRQKSAMKSSERTEISKRRKSAKDGNQPKTEINDSVNISVPATSYNGLEFSFFFRRRQPKKVSVRPDKQTSKDRNQPKTEKSQRQ
jgi:hypothetical protein